MRGLLTLILFLALLTGSVAGAYDMEKFGVVSSRDFNARGITIGDSYDKVMAALGKPNREERVRNEFAEGNPVHLYYDGIYVFITDNEVGRVRVTGKDVKIKGVSVGDKADKVIAVFGAAKLQTINGRESLRYVVKSPGGELTDAQLIFIIEKGDVSEIVLFFELI